MGPTVTLNFNLFHNAVSIQLIAPASGAFEMVDSAFLKPSEIIVSIQLIAPASGATPVVSIGEEFIEVSIQLIAPASGAQV